MKTDTTGMVTRLVLFGKDFRSNMLQTVNLWSSLMQTFNPTRTSFWGQFLFCLRTQSWLWFKLVGNSVRIFFAGRFCNWFFSEDLIFAWDRELHTFPQIFVLSLAVNADECLMTRLQEMSLDYHFSVEQEVGSSTYSFFGFNGKQIGCWGHAWM